VGVLALASGIIASASVNHAHAADDKMSEARAASTHTCSVLGYKSAKEYNSSTWPWYTYSTCMTEYGQKPIRSSPDTAWPLVVLKPIPVIVRHTRLIGKLLEEIR
jgi:hypothetical protein